MIDALEFFIVAKEKAVCIGQTRLQKLTIFFLIFELILNGFSGSGFKIRLTLGLNYET